MKERLQKFIASTGFASRRKAETLMVAGLVMVNGKRMTKLGTLIDPSKDVVSIQGKELNPVKTFTYIALNKPVDIVCTRAQFRKEKTVYDIVPKSRDLVIAGRLDKDSEGLVLLTNDGELTNKLTHPRYQHQKEYEVVTYKPISPAQQKILLDGVKLEEGTAIFDKLEEIEPKRYRVIIHQGWKRQIRRSIAFVHHDIRRLMRIRMNKLTLQGLKPGEYRQVEKSDIM